MKLFTLSLLMIFSFQILDIPPMRNAPNPKTCCGRPICLCTHAKGAFCSFRAQKMKQEHPIAQKHCHLPKPAGKQVAKNTEHPKAAFPQPISFSKAPCHTDAPKTAMIRGSFQDFDVLPLKGFSVHFNQEFLFLPSLKYPKLISVSAIDHPPKLFLSI